MILAFCSMMNARCYLNSINILIVFAVYTHSCYFYFYSTAVYACCVYRMLYVLHNPPPKKIQIVTEELKIFASSSTH